MSKASKIKVLLEREIAEKGISVREIARKTNVSNQTLYGILNGKIEKPQNKTVTKLGIYFGLTRDEILGKTAFGRNEAPPDVETVGKAIRFYGSGAELKRKLVKALTSRPSQHCRQTDEPLRLGEEEFEPHELDENFLRLRDYFYSKYVSGEHLVIPIKEIYANYPDIGETIITLILEFEMSEYFESISRAYKVERETPNEKIE